MGGVPKVLRVRLRFDKGRVPWRTCTMTISASTPRIRVTQVWYGIVLILVAISERTGFAGEWADLLGFLLMMAAALGRLWASAHIAGYKDKRLITFGPYSVCRHPLYAFSLLGGLGVGLVTHSVSITIATVLVLGALHLRAIQAEERYLLERHGESFERYRQQTPMLWPSWKHRNSPDETTLNLSIYRKAFLDAGTFVALYVLIRVLDAARAADVWPTLLHLW